MTSSYFFNDFDEIQSVSFSIAEPSVDESLETHRISHRSYLKISLRKVPHRREHFAQPNKGSHDLNVHLHCSSQTSRRSKASVCRAL
jgi:hypothetical protein